jgi:copper chaperone
MTTSPSNTTTLQVTGMTCNRCVGHVEAALRAVPGVRTVKVDLASGQATLSHDALDLGAVIAAVDAAGYAVAPT